MRDEELFVANALVAHLGGPARAQFAAGSDPPDIQMTVDGERFGVEITTLAQRTFDFAGRPQERATQDAFAIELADELDRTVGPNVAKDLQLHLVMWMPAANGGRFKSQLRKWVGQVACSASLGFCGDQLIEGARVELSVAERRPGGHAIVGFIGNARSSADIAHNARELLAERIAAKQHACRAVTGPLWLALLNDYWLAEARTYQRALQALGLAHRFERIFLISNDGAVTELQLPT